MTGAAQGNRGIYSKNRRFKPYGGLSTGLNLNGYMSNRISSKEYTNPLHTFDRQEMSGVFTRGGNSKKDLRVRSTAHFSTAQHRQSQKAIVGNSL